MRGALPLLALALAGCAQPVARGAGGGSGKLPGNLPGDLIVSTNPCADAILIELVPPARIAAISHFSKNPAASSISAEVAARFPGTAGTAEEVIALNPSLVLTSSFTPLTTRTAYERAGLRTMVLGSPVTIAASKAQVMEIAEAVGAVAQGRVLTARIDAAVAAASPSPVRFERSRERVPSKAEALRADRSRLRSTCVSTSLDTNGEVCKFSERSNSRTPAALLFIAGDLVTGAGTLLDELLQVAGFRDAAAEYGLQSTGTLTIETIATHPPDVILTPDAQSRTAHLRRRVLQRMGARTADAAFARDLVNCGGPTIPRALARLAEIRRSL